MIVDQVARRLGLEPTKRLSNKIPVDPLRREVWAVGNLGSDATWSMNQSYKSGPKDNPRANLVQVDWLKSTKPFAGAARLQHP